VGSAISRIKRNLVEDVWMLRPEERPLSNQFAMTRNQGPDGIVAAANTS
jgi:hypothetical protein